MINAYCTTPITIWKWMGTDSWGEPLSGMAVDVKGYPEWKKKLITNARGEKVISLVTIYLPRWIETSAYLGRALCHEDMIQIDGESVIRAIIDIAKAADFSFDHYEVYLA